MDLRFLRSCCLCLYGNFFPVSYFVYRRRGCRRERLGAFSCRSLAKRPCWLDYSACSYTSLRFCFIPRTYGTGQKQVNQFNGCVNHGVFVFMRPFSHSLSKFQTLFSVLREENFYGHNLFKPNDLFPQKSQLVAKTAGNQDGNSAVATFKT